MRRLSLDIQQSSLCRSLCSRSSDGRAERMNPTDGRDRRGESGDQMSGPRSSTVRHQPFGRSDARSKEVSDSIKLKLNDCLAWELVGDTVWYSSLIRNLCFKTFLFFFCQLSLNKYEAKRKKNARVATLLKRFSNKLSNAFQYLGFSYQYIVLSETLW